MSYEDAKVGSVVVVIGFRSFSAVAALIEDKRNDNLLKYFLPIQTALRRITGCSEICLTVKIKLNDYIMFINDLGKTDYAKCIN